MTEEAKTVAEQMNDARQNEPNEWGCKPFENACAEHNLPLVEGESHCADGNNPNNA